MEARPLLATAVFSGLRLGELLGRTWADLDFEAGLIRVREQLDRRGQRVEPKTPQAVRDVVLMPSLAAVLAEHKLAAGKVADTDPVFASAAGTPLYWRNVGSRGLDKALERAGLGTWEDAGGKRRFRPAYRMRDLRDTYASHLIIDLQLARAARPVQVSRQLGHARVSITLDIYADLFERARHADAIRERMAEREFGTILERSRSETVAAGARRRNRSRLLGPRPALHACPSRAPGVIWLTSN
jgi:integrase